MERQVWGEAEVTFPDWKGTAQLDERRTIPWKGLARACGLDSDEWVIIGFSIGGGEREYDLKLYAAKDEVWKQSAPDADLDVTEFLVHNVDPLEILKQMTHMFSLRMRIASTEGRTLNIASLSDLGLEE